MEQTIEYLCVNKVEAECKDCSGYNSICDYYIPNRMMDTYGQDFYTNIDLIIDKADKIRTYVKNWQNRKNMEQR